MTLAAVPMIAADRDDAIERLHHAGEVVRLTRWLDEAAVPYLLLKGASFDQWLHRTRRARDIDVLVPRSHERAVGSLLRSHGFARLLTEPFTTTWYASDRPLPIDVHVLLKGCGVRPERAWPILASTAMTIDVAGARVATLGSPAREVLVALHVALTPGDPGPLADLAAAVDVTPIERWRDAAVLSEVLRCHTLFALGLASLPTGQLIRRDLGLDEGSPLTNDTMAAELATSLALALVQERRAERWRQVVRFLRVHPLAMRRIDSVNGHAGSANVARRLRREVSSLAAAVPLARHLAHQLKPESTR
jgi:hypothetical protein